MSHYLRHRTELNMRADGFVRVDELLGEMNSREGGPFSKTDIATAVRCNGKARLQLGRCRGVHWVRALQGHSHFAVNPRLVARKVSTEGCPGVVYHATHVGNIDAIFEHGLLRGGGRQGSRSDVFLCPVQ